ncbi:MAG: efflux RND transporter periplasmic adaptor subunit [Desulfobacteraceae bacterium]|nr:MAG: efflux RND transporter periplasmic adaptor subunit [Desulfobacteraceae bacterium]
MSPTSFRQDSDITATLGLDASSTQKKHRLRWTVIIALVIAAVFGFIKWNGNKNETKTQYKTEEARRGDLTITVTATGNLAPTNEVQVGSELSGIIDTVDADYNDQVTVGQQLAKLDTLRLDAEVLQAEAALASSQARVLQAKATIAETHNQLERIREVRKLSNDKAVSRQDQDAAQAALDRALADEASASALVQQAKAALSTIQTDLSKAVIRSPVNGIVLTRSVEPGQTVAASLQAPVLFTLAEDLARMELIVDVDEADVAEVKAGQSAEFTVDAYPDRKFPAKITQVRYGAKTVDGVVTYETVLLVDNSDLLLRPGMTATADINVNHIANAVLVPNAALRFSPPEAPAADKPRAGVMAWIFPRPPQTPPKQKDEAPKEKNRQNIWILKNGQPVAVSVITGPSDGQMTEIKSGDVAPGTLLVVDTVSPAE